MVEVSAAASSGTAGTRRQLLDVLKRRGEARADELAGALDVTVSATRQHLAALQTAGLVEHRELKGTPGRPKHVYRLAAAAEDLFPKAYDQFAVELLQYIGEEDPKLLARVFERRRKARLEHASVRLTGKSFGDRVQEVARILDEDGYLASFVRLDDGSYRVEERNCTLLDIAQSSAMPCLSELDFLREALPDAHVERVAHIVGGAHLCAYQIRQTE